MTKWDYFRCEVLYSGEVNLPVEDFKITDMNSFERAKEKCDDDWLNVDEKENWEIKQNECSSSCVFLGKCTFTCSAKRNFETDDP